MLNWRYIKGVFKKSPNFCYKDYCSIYIILSTVLLQAVPSTAYTPFPTFLPLSKCFLERTFCGGAQFSYRIFLNLPVVWKRRPFKVVLSLGNRKKSSGAKSGEQGGWGTTAV